MKKRSHVFEKSVTRIWESTTSGRQFFKVPGVGFYSSLKSSAAVVFVYKPGQMLLTKSAPGRFQNMSFLEKQNPIFSQNRITFFSKTETHFHPKLDPVLLKKRDPLFSEKWVPFSSVSVARSPIGWRIPLNQHAKSQASASACGADDFIFFPSVCDLGERAPRFTF